MRIRAGLAARAFRRLVAARWTLLLHERRLLVWMLAIISGVATAYAILLFRLLIEGVQSLWLGGTIERMATAAASAPWWHVLAAPALAGLIVGLGLKYLMPAGRMTGVADVIEATEVHNARIPLRDGLIGGLLTAVSLGGGASAGREGPAIHIGASLASALAARFNLPPASGRILLGCGVAAAVSASFNAPIAGVLFAHEVILGHIAVRAFVPIALASVTASVITRLHLGDFPAFIIPGYALVTNWEFPAFALLGVFCAGVAIAFLLACNGADRVARRLPLPLWIRPLIAGLAVGMIGISFPQVLGVGYEATDTALKQGYAFHLLLILIAVKILATAITLAGRFGGGVFSPSLYLGAMTGGAFGLALAALFPVMVSSHGLYAIVGMGAVASAVLGAPISTTLIAFELTGDYKLALALMLAISISTALTLAVVGRSYYHAQLERRGIALSDGPQRRILKTVTVRDFMRTPTDPLPSPAEDTPPLFPAASLGRALELMETHALDRYPVSDPADPARIIAVAEHHEALRVFNRELIAANLEAHR